MIIYFGVLADGFQGSGKYVLVFKLIKYNFFIYNFVYNTWSYIPKLQLYTFIFFQDGNINETDVKNASNLLSQISDLQQLFAKHSGKT